jgi:limonene-1,2-epoxide hydrolase
MTSQVFPVDEVDAAFRNYWQTGSVSEDWDGFAEMFTDDVDYREHFLGHMHGREEVRAWIKKTMADFSEIYTVYEWHMVEASGRVVVYMQNRRDNPEPGAPPIDFPGITVLQYAGDGRFSLEEDFWAVNDGMRTAKEYAEACARFDPEHAQRRTRRDWGDGPDWARGPVSGADD